jgi:hypothetical protein
MNEWYAYAKTLLPVRDDLMNESRFFNMEREGLPDGTLELLCSNERKIVANSMICRENEFCGGA